MCRQLTVLALSVMFGGFAATKGYGEVQDVPVFQGSAYEIGVQHGEMYAEDVGMVVAALYENYLSSWAFYYWAVWQAEKMDPFIPEHLKQEMQGIADGAKLDYTDVLLGNVLPDLLMLYGSGAACSSYLITPGRSAEGGMLYGRNLDWYHDLAPLMRSITKPMIFAREGSHQVMAVGIPGMVGVLSGINERGVTMTLMYSWFDDLTPHGIPLTLLYRSILEQADDAQEALSLFELSGPRTIAINTLLADGGSAMVLESTSERLAVRQPNTVGVLYAANHFESKELIGDETPERDYRWPALTQWDTSTEALNADDLRQVIAATGMETDSFTNVLAFMIDYKRKTLLWGTDGSPAADGLLHEIDWVDAFQASRPRVVGQR